LYKLIFLKMKKIFTLCFLALLTFASFEASGQVAKKVSMKIQTSDPSAKIFVNGAPAGNGLATIKIFPNQTVEITTELGGWYSQRLVYQNNGFTKIPKVATIKMLEDKAWNASVATDIANVDVNIVPKRSQADTWKAINAVVMQYFDAIEVSDKDNYYLRTAWVLVNEGSGTYRTRVIVKANGETNFSIKVVSESAPVGTSAKEDEKFKSWDRVFKKYANLVSEIQNRL